MEDGNREVQDYLLNTGEVEVEEGHRVVQDFLGVVVVLDIKVELQVSLTPSQDFGKQKY